MHTEKCRGAAGERKYQYVHRDLMILSHRNCYGSDAVTERRLRLDCGKVSCICIEKTVRFISEIFLSVQVFYIYMMVYFSLNVSSIKCIILKMFAIDRLIINDLIVHYNVFHNVQYGLYKVLWEEHQGQFSQILV